MTQLIADQLNDNTVDFPVRHLEQKLKAGFQSRTLEEFKTDPGFNDFWGIEIHHIKKGDWKKAYTFSNSHEGISKGFFPIIRGATDALIEQPNLVVGGAQCVRWETLLKKHSKRTYLDTYTTLHDYAKLNKKLILHLRDIDLKKNTGKVIKAPDGRTLYVARFKMGEKDHILFSTITNLDCVFNGQWVSTCYRQIV
jgi:hypothetical protein